MTIRELTGVDHVGFKRREDGALMVVFERPENGPQDREEILVLIDEARGLTVGYEDDEGGLWSLSGNPPELIRKGE